MLKRFRLDSIGNSKLRKYLLYGVGEIIIIVIGIFVALEFDKLKVEKEKERLISEVLKNVQYEIQSNIQSSTRFISLNVKRDLIAYKILNNKLTVDDYIKDDNATFDISGVAGIYYKSNLLDDLKKQVDYLNEPEKKIYKLLLQLNKSVNTIETYTENAHKIVSEHKKYQRENHDWYYSIFIDSASARKEYNYRINNYRYKNFIQGFRTYEITFKSLRLSYFQIVSARVLIDIINDLRTEELSTKQIDSVFIANKMVKLDKIPKDSILEKADTDYEVFDDVSFYHLLYNSSSDTINIRKEASSKNLMSISPNSFMFNTFPIGTELHVFTNDSIQAKYKTEVNGYLFYE